MKEQIEKLVSTRRRFLVEAAVFGAVTAGGLAGCSTSPNGVLVGPMRWGWTRTAQPASRRSPPECRATSASFWGQNVKMDRASSVSVGVCRRKHRFASV